MKPGRRTLVEMLVVGAIATAALIVIALSIHWFPPAASKQAGPLDTLWFVLLGVSIPIFVLVCVVVVYSVRMFRMRPGQELEDGAPIHGNTRLEVLWTAIPVTLIFSLVIYSYIVLHDIEKAPANAATQEMHVHVIAQQFAWQFEYKDKGGKLVKADQLYLPEGRSVKFDINSKDVIHDFWVPAFRIKIDTVPGITTHYRITPTRRGSYPIVCAELCGFGHAFMRSTAHVVSGQQFDTWLANGGSLKARPAGGAGAGANAAGGAVDPKSLFANGNGTSTACGACHTLADAGTTGTTGPDLDKALKGQNAAFIRQSIVDPNAKIAKGYPANVMPQDFSKTLSSAELDALVNYLVKVAAK